MPMTLSPGPGTPPNRPATMRVPDFTPPSQQQQQQRRGGYGDVTPPPEHRSGHGVTRLDQDKVQGLVAMGFPRLNAEFALLARRNDMGRAIDLLVSMTSSGKCTPRPPPSDPLSSKSRPASSRRSSVWEEVDPFLLYEGQPEEEVKALRHELHQRKCAFSRYVNTLRKQPQMADEMRISSDSGDRVRLVDLDKKARWELVRDGRVDSFIERDIRSRTPYQGKSSDELWDRWCDIKWGDRVSESAQDDTKAKQDANLPPSTFQHPADANQIKDEQVRSNDDGVFGMTYSEHRWDFHRVREVEALLRRQPWAAMKTIVVFAWRQSDAEMLADSLMKTRVFGEVEPYHLGRTRGQLAAVMDRFMTGKVRVLVATSGVDLVHAGHAPRADGVIHLTIPKSIENYVKDTKYTGGQPHHNGADGHRGHSHVFVRSEDLLMMHRNASVPLVDPWAATRLACTLVDHRIQPRANARTNTSISRSDQQPGSGQGGGGGRVVAVSLPSTSAMAALKAQAPDDVTTFFRMLDDTIQHQQQQQQQDDPPTTGTTRIYPNVPLTYKLRFLRTTKDAACEKSDFMRSFMATATQDANGVWSVRAVEAVTATDRSPPELSQQLAKAAHDEGFTVGRCDWHARGVVVHMRGGEPQEDGREHAFGGIRAAVEATLQKLYEALKLSLAKLEAAFMALYLSSKETGAQAQLDKLNSLVQAYFAHTEGGAGCHHDPVRVVCEAAVGAAKADGLRVESLLDICGGEIGSESFLRFKHLFASVPMNSDQLDQWGISTLNGVRHRTKIANQLSHAVKNTLKRMPLLYELTERRPTASARDVAVNHLAPLTIARALARINTHSLPKSVSEAFSPITMGATDIATLPFGFLLDAAQRAVTQHREKLLMHTRRRAPGLGLQQEQTQRGKKRSLPAANDHPTREQQEGCAPKKARKTENNKKGNKKRAADTELDEGGQRGAKWRKRNHQAGEGKKRPRETTAVAPTTHHTDQRQRTALPAAAAATAADDNDHPTHKYNTRSKKRKLT